QLGCRHGDRGSQVIVRGLGDSGTGGLRHGKQPQSPQSPLRSSTKRLSAFSALSAVAFPLALAVLAQAPAPPDWKALEGEIMQQFQAILRFDTRNPPGNEHLVADYLKGVFDKAGIPAQIFALDANRSNVVARLKGNGKKKPILIMGHSDVVTVLEAKWKFRPFNATRAAAI